MIPEKYADTFLKSSFQKIRTLMQQRSIKAEMLVRISQVRRQGGAGGDGKNQRNKSSESTINKE